MRFRVVFAVLCLIAVAKSEAGIIDDILKTLVTTVVKVVQTTINKAGNVTFANEMTVVNATIGTFVAGSLQCDKAIFYGLDSLSLLHDFQSDVTNHKLSFSLNVTIPKEVGFEVTNYTADIGIINSIPLYGTNGDIRLAMNEVKINIRTNVNWNASGIYLDDFHLKPSFYFAKVNITQFFNNEEFSTAISDVLAILIDLLLGVWYVEEKCISCAISSVLQSVLHSDLPNLLKNLVSDCKSTCLPSQNSFITSAFRTDLDQLDEQDIKNIIEIAIDQLVVFTENHLGLS